MFAILFFFKFVILEVIDFVFGDRVTLGGSIEVFVLVLTMILARLGLTWTYRLLGRQDSPESAGPRPRGTTSSPSATPTGPAAVGRLVSHTLW